jgi:hypothetical protein
MSRAMSSDQSSVLSLRSRRKSSTFSAASDGGASVATTNRTSVETAADSTAGVDGSADMSEEDDYNKPPLPADALPSAEDLAKAADVPIFAADGTSRPFKSLYSSATEDAAQGDEVTTDRAVVMVIFVRQIFCGVCSSSPPHPVITPLSSCFLFLLRLCFVSYWHLTHIPFFLILKNQTALPRLYP